MFFLLPIVGAAVGAVAGALVTHAAGEKDRRAAEHHRTVANELHTKYSNLEKRYNELADKSKEQIDDLKRKLALAEANKDLLRFALRLQQAVISLMLEIDKRPSIESLREFTIAISTTNRVLSQLNEQLLAIPNEYFTRNLTRASEVANELEKSERAKKFEERKKEGCLSPEELETERWYSSTESERAQWLFDLYKESYNDIHDDWFIRNATHATKPEKRARSKRRKTSKRYSRGH